MLRWRAWSVIWQGCRGIALKKTATFVQLPWKARLPPSVLKTGNCQLQSDASCMLSASCVSFPSEKLPQ